MKKVLNDISIPEDTWEKLIDTFSAHKSLHIIKSFEKELAKSQDARFAMCTNSCTTGIMAALEAIGVGEGDEVVVPALSWGGTWAPAAFIGAKVIPVDFSKDFPIMDVKKIEEKISKKTKAIIAVGLWGQSAGITEIHLLSKKYNVPLIVDAAQLFNCRVAGKGIGTGGDFVVLSFNNTKSLMSLGEGGAVLCNDKKLFQRLLIITQHPVRNFSDIDNLNLLKFNDGFNYNFRIHPFAALLGIKKVDELKKSKYRVKMEEKKAVIREIVHKYEVQEVFPPMEWIESEPNWTKLLFDLDCLNEDSLIHLRESCKKYEFNTGFCCYKLISELEAVKENRIFPWVSKSPHVSREMFPYADNWRKKLLIVSL